MISLAAMLIFSLGALGANEERISFQEFLASKPLDEMCFSENQITRDECYEISNELANPRTRGGHAFERDLRCYYGDLLSLRDVGLWGWTEIQETLAWAETPEGRRSIGERSAEWTVEGAKNLAQRGEDARDRIRRRREGGLPPIACYWLYFQR
jgi:hypothetical protein